MLDCVVADLGSTTTNKFNFKLKWKFKLNINFNFIPMTITVSRLPLDSTSLVDAQLNVNTQSQHYTVGTVGSISTTNISNSK